VSEAQVSHAVSLGLMRMAVPLETGQSTCMRNLKMKMLFALSFALFLISAPSFAQTTPRNADDGQATETHHMNVGWFGLIGLAGLLGMRRQKSVEHQRMESKGINVSSVPVHLPEKS
jgi:MYXO-CTERM domain-containing protein